MNAVKQVRVFIIEDHRMFAEALEFILAGERGIEVLGTTGKAEDALEWCERECPDVALMDLDLPGMNGIEATRRLRERCPDAKVVIVTVHDEPEVIAKALDAGASGYVTKTRAVDELVDVVHLAHAGEPIIPSEEMIPVLMSLQRVRRQRAMAEVMVEGLTAREVEILQAFAEGRSNEEVAEALFISQRTVETHVRNIIAKLGVRSKLEAILLALRHRVVRVPEAS